jgi:hypothetical protein
MYIYIQTLTQFIKFQFHKIFQPEMQPRPTRYVFIKSLSGSLSYMYINLAEIYAFAFEKLKICGSGYATNGRMSWLICAWS